MTEPVARDSSTSSETEGEGEKPEMATASPWPSNTPPGRSPGCPPGSEEDLLNRALVAGLMLEVILENPGLLEEADSRRHQLKACLKSTLVAHLAGRIPLAFFHSLAQGLDRWFEVFYPLLASAGLGRSPRPAASPSPPPGEGLLREELFGECLEQTPGLLPRRRHRKLDREKLCKFLEHTGGGWFRLRDFEAHFHVDRKTAWEYVQKLLQAGFLVHNQGHSSAVRYRLASYFLQAPDNSQVDQAKRPGPNRVTYADSSVPRQL